MLTAPVSLRPGSVGPRHFANATQLCETLLSELGVETELQA